MVDKRLYHYLNAQFGFMGAVPSFKRDQLEGLRSVPEARLLVETDSLYMRLNRGLNTSSGTWPLILLPAEIVQ